MSRRRSSASSAGPVVDMSIHGPGVTGATSSSPYLCPYSCSRAVTAKRIAPRGRERNGSATNLAGMVSRSPGGRRPPPAPSTLPSVIQETSTASSTGSAGVPQPPSMSSGLSSIMAAGKGRIQSGLNLVGLGGSRLSLYTSPNSSVHGSSPTPTPLASASAKGVPPALALGTGGGGAANPALATQSEDDVILTIGSLRAFRRSWLREALYWLLGLLTGGLLLLVCKWLPELHVALRFVELEDKADPAADLAMLTSLDGVLSLCPVLSLDPTTLEWLPAARLRQRLRAGEPIVRRFDWRYERFWCEPATAVGAAAGAVGVWTRRAFDLRGRPYSELHRIAAERVAEGILDQEHRAAKVRAATYGPNMTDIEVPPYYLMVVNELLKPFFIFQVFSLCVWVVQEYYVYMYSILAMTTYSVLANAYGEWRNLRALQTLARSESVVDRVSLDPLVGRAGGLVTEAVPSSELHPGDLIRIIPNMTLPCDVVLITGHAILSEAMLTGEAAPVMKASLPPGDATLFRPASERDKKYVLFSGTKVLQARCGPLPRLPQHKALPLEESKYVWETVVEAPKSTRSPASGPGPSPSSHGTHPTLRGLADLLQHQQCYQKPIAIGMVMRTGFSTARGQLVRAILFPPPPKFDFEAQGYRFIWVLCSALLVGIICQVTIYARNHEKVLPTIKDLLNLVTIAIPPALPLSLSIGLQVSFARLKLKGVFCSHTRSVAAAGRVNCLCFDKTGTLTEDGLRMTGVQVVEEQPEPEQQQPPAPASASEQQSMPLPQPPPQPKRKALPPVLGPALEDPAHLYIRYVQEQQQQQQQQQQGQQQLYAPAVLVSLVMAACHSVSTLEEEDDVLNRSTATLTLSAAKRVFEGMHEPGGTSGNLLSTLPMLSDVFPMVRNSSLSISGSAAHSDAGDGSEAVEGIALMRSTSLRSSGPGSSLSPSPSFSSAGHLRGLAMQRSRSVGSSAGAGSMLGRSLSSSSLTGAQQRQQQPPQQQEQQQEERSLAAPLALEGPYSSAPGVLAPSSSFVEAASADGGVHLSSSGGGVAVVAVEGAEALQEQQPAEPQPAPRQQPAPTPAPLQLEVEIPPVPAPATEHDDAHAASDPVSGTSPRPIIERRTSFGGALLVGEAGEATVPYVPLPGPAPHQLVGDSLEVQLFLSSGWRFCTRPDEEHDGLHGRGRGRGLRAPADAMLQMAGVFDEAGVWAHPDLPPGTDTVILPPAALAGKPGAVALAVVRRLDFDADLRRMGVIVQVLVAVPSNHSASPTPSPSRPPKGPLLLLVKGAPEAMRELCLPETLPQNLGSELHRLTCSGLRVLGCAWRHVAQAEVGGGREELERDLRFLGLMTMENRLKPETVPYLSLFRSAAFRIIMITGDNPATAAAVGRMAGAFCTPQADAPTLVLDGDGTPEQPLRVSDMGASSPMAGLSLCEYLAAFFPGPGPTKVAVRLPKGEADSAAAAADSASTANANAKQALLRGAHDLVVTGRAFEALHRAHEEAMEADAEADTEGAEQAGEWTALEVVIGKASIFARMSPQHKQDLVRALQDTGLVVCMTGDGANDSGALKAGDIGVSIAAKAAEPVDPAAAAAGAGPEVSKAEAAVLAAPSIAAPFATGIHHIGAVSIILAEGRCALMTSVTMFKYMFLYGIIQFVSVLILYALVLELTAEQYLWADMGVVLGLVVLVPTMGPKAFLQRGRPETNLVSPTILRSIIGQTVIVVIFQVMQQVMLSRQAWYTRSVIDKSNVTAATIPPTNEATSKFLFANYQYICSCLAFCQTYGLFRQPVYRTPLLATYIVAELVIATVFCLGSIPGLEYAFNLTELPLQYRAEVFLLASLYGACAILYERFCVPHVSDDEEPVPPETVGPIPRKPCQGPPSSQEGAVEAFASVSLEEMERAEREKMLCSCLDTQPTLLPKLRRGPPLYHQLRTAWTEAEDRMYRRQREQGFASMAS